MPTVPIDKLEFFRGPDSFTTVKVGNDSQQRMAIKGEDIVTLQFTQSSYIKFKINDWCTVFERVYKIQKEPVVVTRGRNYYEYSITLQHESSDLERAQFKFFGYDNTLTVSEFSIMCNAETIVDLVLENMERAGFTGYTKGEIVVVEPRLLTFSRENCLQAIQRAADEFKTEYFFTGKKINIVKQIQPSGKIFAVAYNRGLTKITRLNRDGTSLVTRLFPFGSARNLPPGYKGDRLHLKNQTPTYSVTNLEWVVTYNGIYETVTFTWTPPESAGTTKVTVAAIPQEGGFLGSIKSAGPAGPISFTLKKGTYKFLFRFTTPSGTKAMPLVLVTGSSLAPIWPSDPLPYLEMNVDKYGVFEHTEFFEDIYPHRTGTVTNVDAANPNRVSDNTIDFDLGNSAVPGEPAIITFNTGQLAGYKFEIETWDNVTKTITFLNSKETAWKVPDIAGAKPAIGDQYVITGIYMPDSYIEAAETALFEAAMQFLETYSDFQYNVQADTDQIFLKRYDYTLHIGDVLRLINDPMEIDKNIRIIAITRYLTQPYKYQITLSDTVEKETVDSIRSQAAENTRQIARVAGILQSTDLLRGHANLPTVPAGLPTINLVLDPVTGRIYRAG